MLSALGMSKIRPVVLMYRETEATLKRPDMVLEEVWILVEVYGFECELS